MVSGTDNERAGEHCHREPCDQQGRGSGRMAGAKVAGIPARFRGAQRANPVYAARYQHLTSREDNKLTSA
jgi:hypothetical protein